ncbi:MAG: hypothetical protein ABSB63_14025 [Spirochaetia bacterium]|jgi:hypothetical protein
MNRNIITEGDAKRLEKAPTAPTKDTYFDRLYKYVPMEIIGAYLVIEGSLKQLLKDMPLLIGLLVLFVLGILSTWLYARRALNVIRGKQLAMSAFAFVVWVFATGGWFETFTWWAPGWGTIAVVAFAVMVAILKIGPLPEPEPQPNVAGS